MSDLSLFFGQFIRKPSQIRAVIPTGRATAHEMARHITPDMQAVAEIGAGTGNITKAILARGLPPARLDVYELNAAFCDYLENRFPGVTVNNCPAQEMLNCAHKPYDSVISTLPTLVMPDDMQSAIIGAAIKSMRPGAPFVQFTYGHIPPLSENTRREFNLSFDCSRRIWANLPPARVYVFRQKPVTQQPVHVNCKAPINCESNPCGLEAGGNPEGG